MTSFNLNSLRKGLFHAYCVWLWKGVHSLDHCTILSPELLSEACQWHHLVASPALCWTSLCAGTVRGCQRRIDCVSTLAGISGDTSTLMYDTSCLVTCLDWRVKSDETQWMLSLPIHEPNNRLHRAFLSALWNTYVRGLPCVQLVTASCRAHLISVR